MHSFKVLIYYCSLFDFGLKGVVPWGATHEYNVRNNKLLTLTLHCACACTLGGGVSMRGMGKTRGGPVLEGGARRGAGRGSNTGRVRWKGPLEGGSNAGRGSSTGSSKGFQRRKGFEQGVLAGVPAVTSFLFVIETMEKAVAALVGSIPQLKPYTAIKGKARAQRRHHIQAIMQELLVDLEAVVVEGDRGWYIRFAGHDDNEDPRVVRASGLWATGSRLKLSLRQMLAPPRECTRRDLTEARTRLTPYSTTTYAINGPNMIKRRCAATATLEDLVFTQLKIAETLGELEVETGKIWVLICPDATSLWHTSVTKIDISVNCWSSGFSVVGGIHTWVMWVCPRYTLEYPISF